MLQAGPKSGRKEEKMKREELMELLSKANIMTRYRNGPCKLYGFLNGPQIEKASWGNNYSVSCDTVTARCADKITEWKVITVRQNGQAVDVGSGKTWAEALAKSEYLMTVIKQRAMAEGKLSI